MIFKAFVPVFKKVNSSKQMFCSKRRIRQRAQFSVLNHMEVISIDAVFYLGE